MIGGPVPRPEAVEGHGANDIVAHRDRNHHPGSRPVAFQIAALRDRLGREVAVDVAHDHRQAGLQSSEQPGELRHVDVAPHRRIAGGLGAVRDLAQVPLRVILEHRAAIELHRDQRPVQRFLELLVAFRGRRIDEAGGEFGHQPLELQPLAQRLPGAVPLGHQRRQQQQGNRDREQKRLHGQDTLGGRCGDERAVTGLRRRQRRERYDQQLRRQPGGPEADRRPQEQWQRRKEQRVLARHLGLATERDQDQRQDAEREGRELQVTLPRRRHEHRRSAGGDLNDQRRERNRPADAGQRPPMPSEPEVVDPTREKERLDHQRRDDRHGQDHAEDEENRHLPKFVQPRRLTDETLHGDCAEDCLRGISAELHEHDQRRDRALKVTHQMQVHREQRGEV